MRQRREKRGSRADPSTARARWLTGHDRRQPHSGANGGRRPRHSQRGATGAPAVPGRRLPKVKASTEIFTLRSRRNGPRARRQPRSRKALQPSRRTDSPAGKAVGSRATRQREGQAAASPAAQKACHRRPDIGTTTTARPATVARPQVPKTTATASDSSGSTGHVGADIVRHVACEAASDGGIETGLTRPRAHRHPHRATATNTIEGGHVGPAAPPPRSPPGAFSRAGQQPFDQRAAVSPQRARRSDRRDAAEASARRRRQRAIRWGDSHRRHAARIARDSHHEPVRAAVEHRDGVRNERLGMCRVRPTGGRGQPGGDDGQPCSCRGARDDVGGGIAGAEDARRRPSATGRGTGELEVITRLTPPPARAPRTARSRAAASVTRGRAAQLRVTRADSRRRRTGTERPRCRILTARRPPVDRLDVATDVRVNRHRPRSPARHRARTGGSARMFTEGDGHPPGL